MEYRKTFAYDRCFVRELVRVPEKHISYSHAPDSIQKILSFVIQEGYQR